MNLALGVIGWAAAAALLVAYALVSTGRLPGRSGRYQALNLAGAAGLTLNSGVHQAWPSAALNMVWIAIGLGTVARTGSRRPVSRRPPVRASSAAERD